MDDGVSLCSTAHPRRAWYRRLWDWVYWWIKDQFGGPLSDDSLEDIEIELPDRED